MKWVKLNGEMDANLSPAERKNFFKAISSPKSEKGTTENGFSKGLELMLASKGFYEIVKTNKTPIPTVMITTLHLVSCSIYEFHSCHASYRHCRLINL